LEEESRSIPAIELYRERGAVSDAAIKLDYRPTLSMSRHVGNDREVGKGRRLADRPLSGSRRGDWND